MPTWLHALYDTAQLQQLLAAGGPWLIAAIIFAETGLFIGFFLPGDSLLLTAGVMCAIDPLAKDPAAAPLLSLVPTVALAMTAAVVGNQLNFGLGRLAGDKARQRPDGRFFKRRHLAEAEAFYVRWGLLALIGGRFIPVVRTFVPFAAGIAGMAPARFLLANILGAVLWVGSMLLLGYALAHNRTLVAHLHLLVLAVVAVSLVPIAIGLIRRWRGGPEGR